MIAFERITIRIVRFIFVGVFISSCADQLELQNPINKQLDSEIRNRLMLLQQKNELLRKNTRPEKIHEDIQELANKINRFDESLTIAKKADNYFETKRNEFAFPDTAFIKLSIIENKAQLITAIKLNELGLFDRLLLVKDSL